MVLNVRYVSKLNLTHHLRPFFRNTAGSNSLDGTLPPEENNANRLVEQIQELIEFLANRCEIWLVVLTVIFLNNILRHQCQPQRGIAIPFSRGKRYNQLL